MGYADGDDFISGAILSYQQMIRIKNNFYQATAPSNLQGGMIHVDSDDDKAHLMGASATEEILQLTRSNDKDPQFNEPEFKGLNIVCIGDAVVCLDDEVVFKATF